MATINLRLDDGLRDRFKAHCAARGRTMRGMLVKMIQWELTRGASTEVRLDEVGEPIRKIPTGTVLPSEPPVNLSKEHQARKAKH